MQKILFKRTFREIKQNFFRYFSLLLLIVFCMTLVVGLVAASESVIQTVNIRAEENCLEDGEFCVFSPLEEEAKEKLAAKGAVLEEIFYLDYDIKDGSVLRVMKTREKINLLAFVSGREAQTEDEIVLERIYASEHGFDVGDTVTVGEHKFEICGIATTPDYDCCLRNMSDMSSDGRLFGTSFVTKEAYEDLRSRGNALSTEEYRYSYRLENGLTDEELKDILLEEKISLKDVDDKYFQEMAEEKLRDRNEAEEGIAELADGSDALSDALISMEEGAASLSEGIGAVHDGVEKLNANSGDLTKGSSEVEKALKELEKASKKLSFSTDSAKELKDASEALASGAKDLEKGLRKLEEQSGKEAFQKTVKDALSQNGMDIEQLSGDAKLIMAVAEGYLDHVGEYLSTSADGASTLAKNLETFDEGLAKLPASLETLNDGITEFQKAISMLTKEYEKLDTGIAAYTEGVSQIEEGTAKLLDGSRELSEGAKELSQNGEEFKDGVLTLQSETEELLEEYFPAEVQNLTDFVKADDNPRIKAANGDVEIADKAGTFAGVILLALITYVLSVFTVHSIDRESAVIGALYALGVKRRQLMMHYAALPTFLCLTGGIVGTAVGYSDFFIRLFMGDTYAYYSIPEIETYMNPYLLAYGVVMPPVTALIISLVVVRKGLDRTALSLLRRETAAKKISARQFHGLGFVQSFRLRQLMREKRSNFAVLAGMFVSLLVLCIGLTCYSLCNNLKIQNTEDVKYETAYFYKYPEKQVPDGGYEAYVEGLKKEVLGYDMEVTVIGLTKDNPFFPSITSNRKNEISIASSTAQKYGLKKGDTLILRDEVNERDYSFTVKEIVKYSVGLCAFMEIDSMRELFDQEEDYYNAVYADNELEVDSGRLYSMSTREDTEKSAEVFIDIMKPMVSMMTGAAALIFLVVLYQMMKVMIDRSAGNIAMMKIFGYRDRELRKLYLDGNFVMTAIGALILLPCAKGLMDVVYPLFVANVACGTNFSWNPWLYVASYAGILLSYLLIRALLMYRVRKIMPVEVLKERE